MSIFSMATGRKFLSLHVYLFNGDREKVPVVTSLQYFKELKLPENAFGKISGNRASYDAGYGESKK